MTQSKADTPAGSNGFVKTEPDDYTLAQCSTQWTPIPAPYHHGHHDPFDVVGYPTPSLKRSRSDNSDPVTPENDMHPKPYRRWPSETATTDSANPSEFTSETTELDEDNDSSKLKGIKYPGMGLFDSADENQRRMRNQRKDDSVLKQMEETSSGIAPNEMVLTDGTLEFQRFRDIYASPSVEGTPVGRIHITVIHRTWHWFECRILTHKTFSRTGNSKRMRSGNQSVVVVPMGLLRSRCAHVPQPD